MLQVVVREVRYASIGGELRKVLVDSDRMGQIRQDREVVDRLRADAMNGSEPPDGFGLQVRAGRMPTSYPRVAMVLMGLKERTPLPCLPVIGALFRVWPGGVQGRVRPAWGMSVLGW
jgi:hypothetical protein